MRQPVGIIGLLLFLAACGQTPPPSPPTPNPPFAVTRFAPSGTQATCWEPCWSFVAVTVEVDDSTERTEWTLATSQRARDGLPNLIPQFDAKCEAMRCELVFGVLAWQRKYEILPARLIRTVGGAQEAVRVTDWIGGD